VLVGGLVLVLGSAAPAQAIPGPKLCDTSKPPTPEMAGTGMESMLNSDTVTPAQFLELHTSPNTLFGRYGGAGVHWHTFGLSCFDFNNPGNNWFANGILGFSKSLASTSQDLLHVAFDPGLLDPLNAVVDRAVGAMRDALYLEWMIPIISLGALWAAWVGLGRRQGTQVVESAVWIVGVIAVSLWLFAYPSTVLTGADDIVTSINQDLYTGFSGAVGQGTTPSDASDATWRVLVYEPWLVGEFGTSDPNSPTVKRFGERLLAAQAYSYDEVARIRQDPKQADPGVGGSIAARKADDFKRLAKELKQTDPAAYQYFSGLHSEQRNRTAFVALIAGLFVAGVQLLFAFFAVVLRVGSLLFMFGSVLILLLGIHPGAGRRAAIRWLNLFLGLVACRIGLAFMLGVQIVVTGIVLQSRTTIGWDRAMILIIALSVALIVFRRPFLRMFSQLGVGGEGGALESFEGGRAQPLRSAMRLFLLWRGLKALGYLGRTARASETVADRTATEPTATPQQQQPPEHLTVVITRVPPAPAGQLGGAPPALGPWRPDGPGPDGGGGRPGGGGDGGGGPGPAGSGPAPHWTVWRSDTGGSPGGAPTPTGGQGPSPAPAGPTRMWTAPASASRVKTAAPAGPDPARSSTPSSPAPPPRPPTPPPAGPTRTGGGSP
jgi:hypothetical protein